MPKKYTLEYKKEAIKLVTEQGYSQEEAARILEVSSKNINRWIKQFTGSGVPDKKMTPEQEEIKRLRKENDRLRMEREILKKAAAFFAGEKS